MVSKKIVAIGGGENGRIKDGVKLPYETGPIDQEIIRLTGKDHPNFLLLAHSQEIENQEGYFKTMKDIYGGKYGCTCKDLKSDELSNKEYVKNLIERADIIYEGGGDPISMIQIRKETKFDEILRTAWEKGKVMCGVSAGGLCWFKECSDNTITEMGIEGLGFVEGLFEPHCDRPGIEEKIKDLSKREAKEVRFVFSNCAALEIIDDQYRVLTCEVSNYPIKKAFGKKVYWKNDKYIEEILDDTEKFKPISELYTRI